MSTIRDILSANRVIPVVALDRIEDTIPICEALLEGGISIIEITLRTNIALGALREAAQRFPELCVGAGTIVNAEQVSQVIDQGARFGVSPGSTSAVLDAVDASKLPFLPAGATVSEFMALSERGFNIVKFFPADRGGGLDFLKSVSSPLARIDFCPTGGINSLNIAKYMELDNVIAVGGSWFVSPERIRRRAWDEIKQASITLSKKFGKKY